MRAKTSGPQGGRPESEQGSRRAGHMFAPCQKHASPLFFGWNARGKRQELREGGDQTVAQQVWSRSSPLHPARAPIPQLLSQTCTVGG